MNDSPQQSEWSPGYDTILSSIASTDNVDVEWDKLRAIIKQKIVQNISLFQEKYRDPPPYPTTFVPVVLQSGGLKLPPFPPRHQSTLASFDIPVHYMNDEQISQMKQYIFEQLDQFEAPPFTIQRVCELCVEPQKHYKAIGKYLRAIEKSLLVTSTWDSFPPLQESDMVNPTRSLTVSVSTTHSTPSTPLFSPIAFLHTDARRSKSRSPPPSPLTLAVSGGPEPVETPKPLGLGLVDELDAPGPGHLSAHPTALTATTSIDTPEKEKETTPIVQTLDSRFVKAEETGDSESMAVDENKENTMS